MKHEYFRDVDWTEWKKMPAPDWKIGASALPALFYEEPNLFDDF